MFYYFILTDSIITESGVLPVKTKLRCFAARTNAPSSETNHPLLFHREIVKLKLHYLTLSILIMYL